jgi:hypothetical protein
MPSSQGSRKDAEVLRSDSEAPCETRILYLDGNSYDTIAEILGISTTNVATKISRIKDRLRRDFAGA